MTQAEKKAKEEEAKKQAEQNNDQVQIDSIKEPFSIELVINGISSVKPRLNGKSVIDGEKVEWGDAIQLKLHRVIDKESDRFGVVDSEDLLTLDIACINNELDTHFPFFKNLKLVTTPIIISVSIKNASTVQPLLSISDLVKNISEQIK